MKKILLASLIAIVVSGFMSDLSAKGKKSYDPYKGYDETVFMDMGLEENIMSPLVEKTEHEAVKSYMTRLGNKLARKKYIVDMMRNDEVVLVTIPTDELFQPNDTLLSPSAPTKIEPILSVITDPMMMKIVYAVHTDNTGSVSYNMNLSHERNNSIYDWLLDKINEDLIVIPYEFGDTDPIDTNESRNGRKNNRRLEIFLIPGPKLISLAQKGELK